MTAFRFRIPTQPISWNRSYRIVRIPHRDGKSHQQLAKTKDGWAFQTIVAGLARQAAPRGWKPDGQVRVRYWMRLKRNMDADNVMKLVHDALAYAWGVDDAEFLPCVVEKTHGNAYPHVDIEVEG